MTWQAQNTRQRQAGHQSPDNVCADGKQGTKADVGNTPWQAQFTVRGQLVWEISSGGQENEKACKRATQHADRL